MHLSYVVDLESSSFEIIQEIFPDVICLRDYSVLIENDDIDILTIATPTVTHCTILDKFKNNQNIRIFFLEKPLCNEVNEYKKIPKEIQAKIVVNYLRRFDKNIQKLQKKIESEIVYNPQKIIINYCKGLKNNGSHLIDLLHFLFSTITPKNVKILNTSNGFDDTDKSYDIYLELYYKGTSIPVYFISHNHQKYNLIEMNLYFENMFICYNNAESQIEYADVVNDKNFPTYQVFDTNSMVDKVDSLHLMLNAYDSLFNMIENQERNISSFDNELKNMEFIKTILKAVQ